jgi:dTDP-4-dehydrorhamnose 3,5-epimerase
MEVKELGLKGILELIPKVFEDDRGYFLESFNEDTFKKLGIHHSFLQDNQSFSVSGAVRGLHFQAPPYEQVKLIRVIKGRVLDVVVDIRKNSPTYGSSLSIELSEYEHKMILIPGGFAHGFSVLEPAIFQYKCSGLFVKMSEGGINPLDPTLQINWNVAHPIVSKKDLDLPDFQSFESPF